MSFAIAELEVIQELSGFRLSLYLAVRHEEFIGGGVCRCSPTELSKKYRQLKNESNTARIRKQMIAEGWFIETGGAIVTRKFTAKNAENCAHEAANIADPPAEKVQKLQPETAKIAGTPVAGKDLKFKEIYLISPPGGAPASESGDKAASGFCSSNELLPEKYSPTRAIAIYREVFPDYPLKGEQLQDFAKRLPEIEESVWRQNLLDWKLSNWQAGNISGMIDRYYRELKESEKRGGKHYGKRRENYKQPGKQDSADVRARLRARPPTSV